jgi:hypothetical protein
MMGMGKERGREEKEGKGTEMKGREEEGGGEGEVDLVNMKDKGRERKGGKIKRRMDIFAKKNEELNVAVEKRKYV